MDSLVPRVIVGLGNPGARHAHSRHNAGFMVLDALAGGAGAVSWFTEGLAETCRVNLEGKPLILVKPLAYMNRSGEAIRLLRSRYEFAQQDMMIVLDDLSLPFGRLRIRERGGAGGHHGLESLLIEMESDEIPRLRLGIGEEQMPDGKAEFVLSDFPAERRDGVNEMIARACDAVRTILRDGVPKAMAVYNA
jgi:peptidyl-tRNA hydrolase, PTH1 family